MAFQEDKAAKRALDGATGKRVLGVECPLRNGTGDVCKECERVKHWWRQGDADSEKRARDHQAKESYFLNILNRDGEYTILKIGKKVAKSLKTKLDKYKARTGKMFGFANLEEGEWLSITKEGEHPNFEYNFSMEGEKAEPVTEAEVKALPSLKNLTADFTEGLLDIFDISTLNSGDSYEFRMVPIPTGDGMATEMIFRYYHWRCSEAEILGGGEVGEVVKTGEDTPQEFSEFMSVDVGADDTSDAPADSVQYTLDDPPGCFGHFDSDDDDCKAKDCALIAEACAEEKAKRGKKPSK